MARDKLIQRKIYDLLSNRPLMAFVTVFLFVLCVFQIYGIYVLSSGGMVASLCERAGCSARRGGVEEWGGEPVDVVYTWVNGSDPTWLQELRALAGGRDDIDPSRYDDKQELKYSLRSLELYAPWVRHVYVVTAGQLPWWLDASAPRLTLVAHSDIMPAQFLPTFSSPAIESFIHKIPGLSERFLYFNDDIFLGSPLFPSDLYTPSDGYELYTAWNVPECAVGCPWSFLGDKSCDSACNVAACEHDGGDCQGPPQHRYGLGNPPLMPDDYDSPFFDEEERLDADASVGRYPGFDEPPFDSKIVHARQHEDQDLLDSLRPEPGFDSRETRLVKRETEDEFWTPIDTTGDMVHYKNTMRSLKSFRESENSSEEEIKHISDLKLNLSDLTLDIEDLKLNSSKLTLNSLLKNPDINDLNISNDAIKYTRTLGDGTTDYVPDISDLKLIISHLELVGSLKEQHTNDSNLGSDSDKSYLDIEGFRTLEDDETMDEIQGMKDEFEDPLDHPTGGMAIHKITIRSLKGFRESQSRSKEDIEKLNINDLKLNISSLQSNNALKRPNANGLNLRNVVLKNNLVIRDIRTLGDGTVDEIPNVNSRLGPEAEPKHLLDKNNLDIRTLGDDNAKIPDMSDLKLTGEIENYSELGKEEPKNLFKKSTESLTEKNHLDIIIFRNGKPGEIRDLKLVNVEKDNKFQLGREVPKNLYQSSENLMEKLKRAASVDKSNVSKAVNHFNKSYLKADKRSRQKKSTYEELADDSEPGDERKLAMYARSLIYTNKLLNKEFGFQNRKVPAHVPFLLERSVLEALHARWPTQVADTARNRFRRPNDLQFAFAYYYFLINERRQLTIQQIFDKYDTDKSGTWSDREVRTVLARVRGLPLTAEAVRALEAAARSCDSETNRAHPTPPAERYLDSDMPTLSKELVCGCAALAGPLRSSLGLLPPRARPRPAAPRHTFAMLDSNLTKAVAALDEIRRDTKKFICINDNLDPAREEENVIVRMLLQELYEALLPLPSSFELPPGVANRFLRLEELEAWRAGRRAAWLGLALCAALLTALSLYHLRSFRRSLHRVNSLL